MKGDFSRIRFNRLKGYTAVLEQQGRVALDADANEQCFIDAYGQATETVDVIGEYGAPIDDAGFEITINGEEILVGPGRYYVGGLLCENQATLSYDQQPFLLDGTPTAAELLSDLASQGDNGVLQLYLEVWQRLVTALDDPCLREPALGRADTTARLQTVWRVLGTVVTLRAPQTVSEPGSLTPCCQVMYEQRADASTGKMSAATNDESPDCGCEPVAGAGYQGLENQLYRVEIHEPGSESTATFKWSRENASVVAAITDVAGATVTLNSLGPDANLGFGAQQWVEVSDERNLFGATPNQPGTLHEVQSIQRADIALTLDADVGSIDPALNARLRRWDQSGPSAGASGIPLGAGAGIALENGIQVSFAAGAYNSGDYWTIPARTASGAIDWPPCGGNQEAFQAPMNIEVNRAPLGCVHWHSLRIPPIHKGELTGIPEKELTNVREQAPASVREEEPAIVGKEELGATGIRLREFYTVDDCRLLFSPLTALSVPTSAQAIHVDAVNWVNDDVITFDRLVADGLTVTLDQVPVGPINGANFIVTFEVVRFPSLRGEQDVTFTAANVNVAATLDAMTLMRGGVIVDASISTSGKTVSWQLPYANGTFFDKRTVAALDELISPGADVGIWTRVRIELLGEAIFANGAGGLIYLDGRAFGKPGTRADGSERIDLALPSGDGSKASDLDGWFYLAPILAVETLTIAYPAVTTIVGPRNRVTGVEAVVGDGTEKVDPTATVELNYPPLTAMKLSLVLTGASGVDSVASVPAEVEIPAGKESVTFPISILGNPGAETTLTFELTASVVSAAGPSFTQAQSFTVTGRRPLPEKRSIQTE